VLVKYDGVISVSSSVVLVVLKMLEVLLSPTADFTNDCCCCLGTMTKHEYGSGGYHKTN
jgi:hypothetical protein